MNLYDIAVARKLSGGGGGSSDFSTAEVTVINESAIGVALGVINIQNDALDEVGIVATSGETSQGTCVLYKGESNIGVLVTWDGTPVENYVVSGSIIDNDGLFTITGNGTITIS